MKAKNKELDNIILKQNKSTRHKGIEKNNITELFYAFSFNMKRLCAVFAMFFELYDSCVLFC